MRPSTMSVRIKGRDSMPKVQDALTILAPISCVLYLVGNNEIRDIRSGSPVSMRDHQPSPTSNSRDLCFHFFAAI